MSQIMDIALTCCINPDLIPCNKLTWQVQGQQLKSQSLYKLLSIEDMNVCEIFCSKLWKLNKSHYNNKICYMLESCLESDGQGELIWSLTDRWPKVKNISLVSKFLDVIVILHCKQIDKDCMHRISIYLTLGFFFIKNYEIIIEWFVNKVDLNRRHKCWKFH